MGIIQSLRAQYRTWLDRLAADTSRLEAEAEASKATAYATRQGHRLTAANRRDDFEQAGEFLAARFNRKYPTTMDARLKSGFDPRRDYDREREEARHQLQEALSAEWAEGRNYPKWIERAAHRVRI